MDVQGFGTTDTSSRLGDYIQTHSGILFYPADPRPEEICLEDIAHALSMQCRYGGHTPFHYCPTPEQRILTADLRWVPAGDLVVGDRLIGFDEHPVELGAAGNLRRRYRPSTVTATVPVKRHIWRLEMEDGSTVRNSSEHPWLVATKTSRNQKWVTTEELVSALSEGRARYMHKFIEPWETESSYSAGWLAGIYDGEGSFAHNNRRGVQLAAAQNPGLVLDRMTSLLASFGFPTVACSQNAAESSVINVQLGGGWREVARFLGALRPIRLLDKFTSAFNSGTLDKQMDGKNAPSKIIAAYDEGEDWVAGLSTSTHTYLCEGYAAHNSVAQHSILCAEQAMIECPNLALTVLMHDAAEAYLVDLPRPIKKMLTGYYAMEHLIEEVIAQKYNLFFPFPDVVRSIDNRMLCTEGKAFFDQFENKWWEQPTYGAEIYGHIKIEKWSPLLAEQRFRQMFKMLA